jgi:hypothetical protein
MIKDQSDHVTEIVLNSMKNNFTLAYTDSIFNDVNFSPDLLTLFKSDLSSRVYIEYYTTNAIAYCSNETNWKVGSLKIEHKMDCEKLWMNLISIEISDYSEKIKISSNTITDNNRIENHDDFKIGDKFFQKFMDKSVISNNNQKSINKEKKNSKSEESIALSHAIMKEKEIRNMICMINSLSFCKVVIFRSEFLQFKIHISEKVAIILEFKTKKVGTQSNVSLIIEKSIVNLEEDFEDNSNDIESRIATAYFKNILCNNAKGLLCLQSLQKLRTLSQIPLLLKQVMTT